MNLNKRDWLEIEKRGKVLKKEWEHEHALTISQLEFDTQKEKREDDKANARSKPKLYFCKNISLVSRFKEKDVHKYLIHFEKVAKLRLKVIHDLIVCNKPYRRGGGE